MADANLVIAFEARVGNMEAGLRRTSEELRKLRRQGQETTRSLSSISASANSTATAMGRLSSATASIGSVFSRIAGPLAALAAGFGISNGLSSAIRSISTLADEASQLALSADALLALRDGFEQAGGSAEQATQGVSRINDLIGDAARGTDTAIKAFADLGIAFRNTDGSIRSTEAVLGDIITKINDATSEQEKLSIATQLFGARAGRVFVSAIEEMGGSLQTGIQRLREMGIAVGDEVPANIDALGTAFSRLGQTMAASIATAVSAMRPELESFFEWAQRQVANLSQGFASLVRQSRLRSDSVLQTLQNDAAQAQVRVAELNRSLTALQSERPATSIIGGMFSRNQEAIDRDILAQREALRIAEQRAAALRAEADQRARITTMMVDLPSTIRPEDRPPPPTAAAPPRAPATGGSRTPTDAERQLVRDINEASRALDRLADKSQQPLQALREDFGETVTSIQTLTANLDRLNADQRRILGGITFDALAQNAEDAATRTAEAMRRAGASTEEIESRIAESVRAYGEQLVQIGRLTAEQVEEMVRRTTTATQKITRRNTTFVEGLRSGAGVREGETPPSLSFEIGQGVAQESLALFDNIANVLDKVAQGSVKAGEAFTQLAVDFAKAVASMIVKALALAAVRYAINAFLGPSAGPAKGPAPSLEVAGFRAAGGPVTRGRTYVVGERGPELFVAPSTGRIEPGLGGGMPSIVINQNAPGVVIERTRNDEEVIAFAVNMSRQKVAADFAESTRTGHGSYAEPLNARYTMRRRL